MLSRVVIIAAFFVFVVLPIWVLFHFVFSGLRERRLTRQSGSLELRLNKTTQAYAQLESRIATLEDYVVSEEFHIKRQ